MQIPFGIQSYKARSLPLSAQRCVNYFAEAAPQQGARSPIVCLNAAGIKAFGSGGLAGSVRGMKDMGGVLYVLAGAYLYSVNSSGVATSLGAINTTDGLVGMAVNRASPQQLCIVDGTQGWTYDTTNGLVRITDGDFLAAVTVAFQDGYFIFDEAGTSNFFISNIDNGQAYTATDISGAEGDPDEVVAVFSNHRTLWVFGEKTTEIYFNSGNADFPFERIDGAYLERGCAAPFTPAADDNTLFWLGDDLIVYRANGYTPERVSTHAIEEAIRKYTSVSDAFAFVYTMSGHKFYVLSFPTGRATFVLDIATGLWHERESLGERYWRANSHVYIYGKHIVGDAFVGQLGELDLDTFAEYGSTMQGILTGPVIHDGNRRIFHRALEIDVEAGVGLSSGQGSDPQVWLDWSDDGGRQWSNIQPFRSLGKIGAYKTRLRWLKMGQARQRVYRLTVSDPVKRSVLSAELDVQKGAN